MHDIQLEDIPEEEKDRYAYYFPEREADEDEYAHYLPEDVTDDDEVMDLDTGEVFKAKTVPEYFGIEPGEVPEELRD